MYFNIVIDVENFPGCFRFIVSLRYAPNDSDYSQSRYKTLSFRAKRRISNHLSVANVFQYRLSLL
jgi:hypothetical protein